jgi:hypothetical protein
MKPEVVKLETKRDKNVRETLEDALHQEFESVIVIGYKDGHTYVKGSGCKHRVELIGALEVAKMETWNGG